MFGACVSLPAATEHCYAWASWAFGASMLAAGPQAWHFATLRIVFRNVLRPQVQHYDERSDRGHDKHDARPDDTRLVEKQSVDADRHARQHSESGKRCEHDSQLSSHHDVIPTERWPWPHLPPMDA